MRKFLIALAILSLSTACAPQASGPPAGDSGATTSSSGLTAPASPAAATSPDAGATPAGMPSGHPPMPGDSASGMPPGHPPMSEGAAPPPGHMDSGGSNVTATDGAVVSVTDKEMIMARPGGTELRFILPDDLKVLPEGKTVADLKEGTKVNIDIRTVERGMEAQTITIQDAPPATR